jgi:hypothetical protein
MIFRGESLWLNCGSERANQSRKLYVVFVSSVREAVCVKKCDVRPIMKSQVSVAAAKNLSVFAKPVNRPASDCAVDNSSIETQYASQLL